MKSFGLWYRMYQEKGPEYPKEGARTGADQENGHLKENGASSGKTDNTPEFSLHVNFWSLEDIKVKDCLNNKKKTKENIKNPCLDIGLKIKGYAKLDYVTFYCPFSLDAVSDLSKKLETKNNANIIFNSDCEIETKDSYTIVNISEHEETLLIFPLEQVIKNVYQVEKEESRGTQITFQFQKFYTYVKEVEKLKDLDTIYIRFRIESTALKKYFYFDSEPLNKSFESAFSGTRIIDFKVNEKRNIDEKIRAEIIVNKQEWVIFHDVHFLVMVPSSYDLVSFYKETMTCRELEEDLWDDYLGAHIDFTSGHVLAYHWKEKASSGKGCEAFACLVKVNYSRAKKETIFLYALSVVALGVLSSMLVTGLNALWPADKIWFWVFGLGGFSIAILFVIWRGKKY